MALQRRICMIYVKKKSVRTSSGSNKIPALLKMAEKFVQVGDETEWSQREKYFHSIRYQAGTWKHDRRVCICSIREASELIFHHEFIITNLLDAIPAKQVYQTHWKRCTMDNFIKEAKNGFFFDKSDSSHDGHRTFLWHKQFYAHASISKKGQRSTDTDYPSSFFQNCWETDPQRKTHDAKTQHPPCLPRRFFFRSYGKFNIFRGETPLILKNRSNKGISMPKTTITIALLASFRL